MVWHGDAHKFEFYAGILMGEVPCIGFKASRVPYNDHMDDSKDGSKNKNDKHTLISPRNGGGKIAKPLANKCIIKITYNETKFWFHPYAYTSRGVASSKTFEDYNE